MKASSRSDSIVKWVCFRIAAIGIATLVALLMAELILRIVPVPGGDSYSLVYDPEMELYKFTPNTTVVRTNVRGERIVRKVNSEGFLDVNHLKRNRNNAYRIGLFGDSFVEAFQVPLESTFSSLIQDRFPVHKVEIFAFGKSRHGTIHSYLKSKKYAKYFDLDMVVYVFSENDLGDQIEGVTNAKTLQSVELVNKQLVINDRWLKADREKRMFRAKLRRFFPWDKSVVLTTIRARRELLARHGIQIKVDERARQMATKGDITKIPVETDLPSTWSDAYKRQGMELGEAVILKWYQETKLSGRKFVILYVPRESEWKKDDIKQDSWKYWLRTYCQKTGIEFIDPTRQFFKYDRLGKKPYDDHFSEDGHIAFAECFLDWLKKQNLERTTCQNSQ